MPLNEKEECLSFKGKIYYHNKVDTTHEVLNELLNTINSDNDMTNKIIVGFDCEWDIKPFVSKVCLIQLCLSSDECHLFQLSAMNYTIPPLLEKLILHKNCIKVGLNIENDIWKLQKDYDLRTDDVVVGRDKSVIDLSLLANQLLGKSNRWSLNGLSMFLFKKTINKDLRLSKWSNNPLTKDQQNYAAIDALASYELYYAIKEKAVQFV